MRPTPRTWATSFAAFLESDDGVAARGEVEQLLEGLSLHRQVRVPTRLRAQPGGLEVEPVEPAAGSPANEVAELDVERHHAARIDLADHLGDLAPEVADAGPVGALDLAPFEVTRRQAAEVRVVLDVGVVDGGVAARREAAQVFARNVIDVERPAGEVDAAQLGDEGEIGEAEQGRGFAVHEQPERHPEAALRPLA